MCQLQCGRRCGCQVMELQRAGNVKDDYDGAFEKRASHVECSRSPSSSLELRNSVGLHTSPFFLSSVFAPCVCH